MDFITVTSIGGSIWSIRKERIEMITKRFSFSKSELEQIPELEHMASCAIIKVIGDDSLLFCRDSYESIMDQVNQ